MTDTGMLMATHSLVLPIVRRGRGVKNKQTNTEMEGVYGWMGYGGKGLHTLINTLVVCCSSHSLCKIRVQMRCTGAFKSPRQVTRFVLFLPYIKVSGACSYQNQLSVPSPSELSGHRGGTAQGGCLTENGFHDFGARPQNTKWHSRL